MPDTAGVTKRERGKRWFLFSVANWVFFSSAGSVRFGDAGFFFFSAHGLLTSYFVVVFVLGVNGFWKWQDDNVRMVFTYVVRHVTRVLRTIESYTGIDLHYAPAVRVIGRCMWWALVFAIGGGLVMWVFQMAMMLFGRIITG